MRKTCLDQVYELAKKDERVVFLGSDLGVGTLDSFKKDFPDRFFMEGICEQHFVGMAAGLAMEGKIVYANTIATFLTRRCYEQVALDLCLHNANVRLIGNGGGCVYAPLGPTHLAIEDIAIMRALPNMTVVCPADAEEMTRFMQKSLDHSGPIYIRLAKGHDPIVTEPSFGFEIGRAIPVRQGGETLVLTTGITLGIAREAAERSPGISILHLPTVKPLDEEAILLASREAKQIITIEEHNRIGGLGSAVADLLAEVPGFLGDRRFRKLALSGEFIEEYGTQKQQMARQGISVQNLIATVENLRRGEARKSARLEVPPV